jgi:hypothetical protein
VQAGLGALNVRDDFPGIGHMDDRNAAILAQTCQPELAICHSLALCAIVAEQMT